MKYLMTVMLFISAAAYGQTAKPAAAPAAAPAAKTNSIESQKESLLKYINKRIADMQLGARCITLAKTQEELDYCRTKGEEKKEQIEKERKEAGFGKPTSTNIKKPQ